MPSLVPNPAPSPDCSQLQQSLARSPHPVDGVEQRAEQAGEIVTLVAAGIHQLTRSVAVGRHYTTGGVFPVIPGLNAVARTAGGDLVFTSSAPSPFGTFAERIAAPAAMRFPLPAGAPAEAVAAGVNPGMASWLPLTARRAEVGPLGTVLILDAAAIAAALGTGAPRVVLVPD